MSEIRVILVACWLMVVAGVSFVAQSKTPSSQEPYPYDKSKQTVVSGIVQEVRDYKCPVTAAVGAHITVSTATTSIEVHLAPATFMKTYEIVIQKGDKIEIEGAKIVFENKPSLVAKTATIDKTTYTFRDPDGKPLW